MRNTAGSKFKYFSVVFSFLLFALTVSSPAWGQSTNATLTGTVTDPSGAAVAGAELTLTNSATKLSVNFVSGENGEYSFRSLVPGTYELKVAKGGFVTYLQKDIILTINASVRIDAAMKMGEQTQTVEVIGDTSLINYDNGTVQGGLEPETLNSLPLAVSNGAQRSSASLATLLPGITTGSSGEAFNSRINGGVQTGDEALLDGATMSEGFMNQSGMVSIQGDFQFSPDMISELKVLASSYEAQYGSTTSGQIVVVSKSGGNSFHGAAYEYLRNSGFNAKQWGSAKRSFDQENDYGFNIGGPVKLPGFHGNRNKAFFYFNWEHYKENGGATQPTLSIPSVKERAGDFTDWLDNKGILIPIYNPRTGQQFSCNGVLNVICPNLEDPIAKAWLAQLPTPTNSNATNNYLVPHAVPGTLLTGTNVYFWRVDDNWGNNNHFYYTYYRQYAIANVASTLPNTISSSTPTDLQNAPIQRFNWEHIFSTVMTNHLTFGYLNRNEDYYSLNAGSQLPGVTGVADASALPQFGINGFAQLGNSTGAPGHNKTTRPTWVINDLASRVYKRHTFTAGVEWRSAQGNIHRGTNQGGRFDFTGATTSLNGAGGSAAADFFIGAARKGEVNYYNVASYYPRQTAWAAHLGDTWRATPKLTLSYGLRWDIETPSEEKHDRFSFFDPNLPNPGAVTSSGSLLPGALAFANSNRRYPENLNFGGFAPRLGVAYSWDQKTVVRAGYGIFFGQAFYPGWNGGMSTDGFNKDDSVSNSAVNGTGQTIPGVCLSQGNVFCVTGGFPRPAVTQSLTADFDNGQNPLYRPFNGNDRPYSSQWNLTIERKFPSNVFISVAYVGSKGNRLLSQLHPANSLNPADPRVQAVQAAAQAALPKTGPGAFDPTHNYLNDAFSAGTASLYGVSAPYTNWASQLSVCGATVAQALLPFPQFCGNLHGLNESEGSSIYHSFQFRAEHRFRQGIYMLLSYTNSKLITDASANVQTLATWSGADGSISPFDAKRSRSLAPDDVPQVATAAFVYDLPLGRGKKYLHDGGALNTVVGGWQFSPIIHYSRGTPMFFRSGTCNVPGSFRAACIPGLLPGVNPFLQDPNSYDPGKGPLLNINAFEPVSVFKFPNYTGSGQRITNLRGPNFKNLDFSFTKNTKITERLNFKISANFFNALNAHYFVNSGNFNIGGNFAFSNDISNGNFGTWNGSVSSPRTIQFAGRFEF